MVFNKNAIAMKRSAFMLCFLLSVVLTGCTVSRSVVSQHVNLSKYRYVALIDNETHRMPAELVQYQIQLYDAVERSGLILVNQYRINEMTESERAALLMAQFRIAAQQEQTLITVNFIDCNSGRPIVSCQGAYSTLGFSRDADINGALKRVSDQIAQSFK